VILIGSVQTTYNVVVHIRGNIPWAKTSIGTISNMHSTLHVWLYMRAALPCSCKHHTMLLAVITSSTECAHNVSFPSAVSNVTARPARIICMMRGFGCGCIYRCV